MSTPISKGDSVSQRITKLLPADVTAAFIAIKSAIPAANLPEEWILYGAIVIAILSPFYFFFVLETKNPIHIVYLIATYIIFSISIAYIEFGNVYPQYRNFISGFNVISVPIWVFLVTPIVARVLDTKIEG